MKGFDRKEERIVDVALAVKELSREPEIVVRAQSTYSTRDYRARNRAVASEYIRRPKGTRIEVVDSGPSGSLDYLLEDDRVS